MKQHIRNKPVKWGFKLWCRCDAVSGYLYQFDMYTGRKSDTEHGLGQRGHHADKSTWTAVWSYCNTTPLQMIPVHHWGQRYFEFFGRENLTISPIALNFGPVIREPAQCAHPFNLLMVRLVHNRRNGQFSVKLWNFLLGNGPRYSYQNFTPYAPWGSPHNAIEILTLTPNNFEKLRKNFLDGGVPGAP